MKRIKVEVKVLDSWGKTTLRELRGLNEGDVIEGILNEANNAVDFKWQEEDAVLWLNSNCIETKTRKKGINLKKTKKYEKVN